MSANPIQQSSKSEEYARWRRRDHANIEAMQDLVFAEVEKRHDTPLPAAARRMFGAIQAAHGGGEVEYEEFRRDYLTIGRLMGFTGTDEAIRSRVRNGINGFINWQEAAGYLFLTVRKGGKILGYRNDGSKIFEQTTFIDQFKPRADQAVQRARNSDTWRGRQGVKGHPGKALEEQVESVISQLTRIKQGESTPGAKDSAPLPLDQYEQLSEEMLAGRIEKIAQRIDERGGDGSEWIERLSNSLSRLSRSYAKTKPARLDYASLTAVEDEFLEVDTPPNGNTLTYEDFESETVQGDKSITLATSENLTLEQLAELEIGPEREMLLEAALFWGSKGFPDIPLHTVYDGICSCKKGSECRTPGKHPQIFDWRNSATTDPDVIRARRKRWPLSNIGAAMGGESRLLAMDVDPRNGGDASLCDLVEAHGPELLDTLCLQTGGGGNHFIFRAPEGFETTRDEIAPGIDIKWNGLIVLPPSIHNSGRRYELTEYRDPAPAPAWLIEELSREPDQQPAEAINFQERSERPSVGGGFFSAGERNNGLRDVACGRWANGWAMDEQDLYQQLREVRDTRCEYAPNDPPPSDEQLWDLVRRTAQKFSRGEYRGNRGDAQPKSEANMSVQKPGDKVHKWWNERFAVGKALREVRDEQLFKAEYATFGEFLEKEFQLTVAEATELIESAGAA